MWGQAEVGWWKQNASARRCIRRASCNNERMRSDELIATARSCDTIYYSSCELQQRKHEVWWMDCHSKELRHDVAFVVRVAATKAWGVMNWLPQQGAAARYIIRRASYNNEKMRCDEQMMVFLSIADKLNGELFPSGREHLKRRRKERWYTVLTCRCVLVAINDWIIKMSTPNQQLTTYWWRRWSYVNSIWFWNKENGKGNYCPVISLQRTEIIADQHQTTIKIISHTHKQEEVALTATDFLVDKEDAL